MHHTGHRKLAPNEASSAFLLFSFHFSPPFAFATPPLQLKQGNFF